MKEILIKDRQTNVLKVLSFRTILAPMRFDRGRSRILMAHFKTNTGCNIFHRPSKGIFKSVRQVKQLILKIQRKRNLIAAEKSHACVRPDRSSYIAHIPSHDDAIFKHLPILVPNQPTPQDYPNTSPATAITYPRLSCRLPPPAPVPTPRGKFLGLKLTFTSHLR